MQCPMFKRECEYDCVGICQRGNIHLSASQPDPTPQDVAAPTLEQRVKSVLDSMDIERKTFTSLTYPPLACSYGLSDPGDILEFARRLLAHE